jgi:histidine ammonia-lyase
MSGHQEEVIINDEDLTLDKVVKVARSNARVKVANEIIDKLTRTSRDLINYVEQTFAEIKKDKEEGREPTDLERKQKMMYGTTTGFGALKDNHVEDPDRAKQLQERIIRSHACGVGPNFDRETTRAIMLLRAKTLASGYCGVRPEIVRQIEGMLNQDIRPCIPEQGSVGASGDLAPLAHLALGLVGVGPVTYKDGEHEQSFNNLAQLKEQHPSLDGIQAEIPLSYKEGLALVNGLTVMTGIGVMAQADAENLLEWADLIGATTLESLLGSSRAFDRIVFDDPTGNRPNRIYRHEGARKSAAAVREMIKGSELINRSTDVHDAYSVRCIPQVHGAVRDALNYVRTTLEHQVNSVDDDPIIFSEEEIDALPPLDSVQPPADKNGEITKADDWKQRRHYEQGNFHGEPVAFAMDMLAIVVAELGNISERRIQMLLDKHHNRGLPSCLIDNPDGINSGYMIAQYTAAALVSENKVLTHPASVDSIPTSANAEDHVSMGTIAARKARKVIENVKNILAIELLCATEALSYRLRIQKVTNPKTGQEEFVEFTGECGTKTRRLYEKVRTAHGVPLLKGEDKILYRQIKRAREEFLSAAPGQLIDN